MNESDGMKVFPLRSKYDAGGAAPKGGGETLPTRTILQNRYEILRVVGRGGMGAVYCARDRRFSTSLRLCAVKEMIDASKDAQTRLESLANFEREANLLAALNHPAIPKIFDYFSEGNRNYLAMEFIEGKNLEVLLEQSVGFLPEDEIIDWALQVCDVLRYLHAQRPNPVIFRDLKPSNIMLSSSGRIMLVDFGIAKVFFGGEKGTMIGTEGYSAPEQYRGIAEPRTDIYSLGATLHHLLTKSDPRLETPFTFQQRLPRQVNPGVSEGLEAVVMKMLEYEIERRYDTADAAGEALYSISRVQQDDHPDSGVLLRPPSNKFRTGEGMERLIWQVECQDEVRSSPSGSDGLIFVGSYDHNLYAFDVPTGKLVWQAPTGGGIASSPFPYQDKIYVGSEDSNIYAFDRKTGKVAWAYQTGGPVRSSPRVVREVLYCGSDDHQLHAVDAKRGLKIWQFNTWRPIRSSPTVAGELVYVGADDEMVYALNTLTGALKWKLRTLAGVISSPAVSDKFVYIGSGDRFIYAIDAEAGFVVWRVPGGGQISSSPCVYGRHVIVGSTDKHLYCVDARNGRVLWQYLTGGPITSSPRVYEGAVYFGSSDGFVYSLVIETGELRWKFKTDGPVPGSPCIYDGVVFIGSTDRRLYALQS